ncbi:DUF4383 domain-containing protein [Nocardia huaxiensis]|uniref:DUF4383 domain-containing protein n=1 Tax=Nocardia huaxiensis TaxID=2755382 RepID=A0A7D6ZL68_9NOCA|nr:DUF4383 domain-containing protein [Nocardia huaxiensis]QLY28305.1 DUF4383 domain-containing protein [Nocardia huaxiensis]UFS98256.1 DUF4383 domain-containing protein [Nocardia huaxiensis]
MVSSVRAAVPRYLAQVWRSPGQILLLVLSVWFVSNGPVAFAMNPSLSFGARMHSCTVMVFGFIPVTVNGWHALFHFVTGIAGLFAARTARSALWYGIGCGWFYLIAAGLGLAGGDNVLGFMAVDTFGNWIHAAEGGLALTAAALTTAVTPAPLARHNPRLK